MSTFFRLKELLHKSECLKCGEINQPLVESGSTIGIIKIPGFFRNICQEQPVTEDGRNLLAEEGVTTKPNEIKLREMKKQHKDDKTSSFAFGRTDQVREYISAIQMFEKIKEDRIHEERHQYMHEMLSFFGEEPTNPNRRETIDVEYKLFPNDPTRLRYLANYAERFAQIQTKSHIIENDEEPFQDCETIIKNSIEAIEKDPILDEPSFQLRIDFFVALGNILCNKLFKGEFPAPGDTSQETSKKMLFGALQFLNSQYLYLNFPKDRPISISDVKQFVLTNHPNEPAPWVHIWVCIRAGLYDFVPCFCHEFPEETENFLADYDRYILHNEEANELDKSNVQVDIQEGYKSLCLSFLYGLDIHQQQIEYHKTAEDTVFCFLASLRNGEVDICDTRAFGVLTELQQLVNDEAKKIFSSNNHRFVFSLLMAIMLKFDACAESLLENKLFPVETVHILMVLKQTGRWDHPIIAHLINEFVHLLPLSMAPQIVDYLSFANDRKILVDFLMSLDLSQYSINLDIDQYPQRKNAMNLVIEEIREDPYSLKSLHLNVICLQYQSACQIITAMSNSLSSYSLFDILEVILICSILPDKLTQIDSDEVDKIGIQNSGCQLCIYALSRADELTQSQRTTLSSNVKAFLNQFKNQQTSYDEKTLVTIKMLRRLLKLLILFDMEMGDIALMKSEKKKQIIPFREADLESAFELISEHEATLLSSSLISATICRFLSSYLTDEQKNREKIQTLFTFVGKIPILSDETNRKLLEFKDQFLSK